MAKKPKTLGYSPFYKQSLREYGHQQYVDWRHAVKKRDKYTCQMPGCGYKGNFLECHHIQKWANNPYAKYDINNGITLCKNCHKTVTGQEEYYAPLFIQIISRNTKI